MIKMTLFLSFGLMMTQAFASPAPLHLDLEMSSDEYRELLLKESFQNKQTTSDDPAISHALKLGERLSKWIATINANRSPETAIRLTSAATRRGIPIDKPNKYSPSIIKKDTEVLLGELPQEMKDVVTSTTEYPVSMALDDETFIKFARRLDRIYQSAARYKSVNTYRSYYVNAASKDVRGYYYLKTNKITANELRDTGVILADQLAPLKEALSLVCLNTTSNISRCKTEVDVAFKNNKVSEFYNKYIARSEANWDSFYKIPVGSSRTDITWTDGETRIPFNTPEIPKFILYLKNNIEAEFRWEGWSLQLIFGTFPDGAYLKFEPGVVPHVNGLGGNEIVMDSNQPIEEYESQWTIRHEFGHVLGLPDCYHEFYDVTAEAYVNYQLDITDLMCSRAGNMNERIFKELKEAYSK